MQRVLLDQVEDRQEPKPFAPHPQVDLSYLLSLMDGDRQRVKELIDIFLSSVPEQLKEMSAHYEAKDWDALQRLVHQSKSNYKYIGILSCGNMLDELEQDLKHGRNIERYFQTIETVKQITEDCILYLEQLEW